ncbi:unnamed protein product [Protopolystoma xenopodis]|uniref:B30.2/SPRY domain-containing protein n=1 Tax=Protopolystoma xenopodis TaxID=117903 RepID=A0A3S5B9D7_9PLAT|nr:unnamed protein product [Protopolystoma xenopodis]
MISNILYELFTLFIYEVSPELSENSFLSSSGRFFYECIVTDDGLCRVGWSTMRASYEIGTDAESFGFGGTGRASHKRQFDVYGDSFGLGDTVGCFLDLDNAAISWSKNGANLGKAFDVPSHLIQAGLFPSVSLKNAELRFNFGATPFKYPQAGWLAIGSAEKEQLIISSKFG